MHAIARTLFDSWVTERRIEGGSSAIALDQGGMAALQVDDEIVINFMSQPEARRLVLYAIIGALPMQMEAAIMRDMLQANLLWAGTGGATLSLQHDPEGGLSEMVLAVAVDLSPHTTVDQLDRAFDLMCSAAVGWKARLEAGTSLPASGILPPMHPLMLPGLKP